jgi:hypothetical protein
VAAAVWAAVTSPKPKLNTIVTPEPFTQWLLGVMPRRMADSIITKRLGLTPEALNTRGR